MNDRECDEVSNNDASVFLSVFVLSRETFSAVANHRQRVKETNRWFRDTQRGENRTSQKQKSIWRIEMNRKNVIARLASVLMATVVTGMLALPAIAQEARVNEASQKSFDQTVAQLQSAVSQGGMMVMGKVDQGNMLAMTGLKLKATLFLVGNPTVGKKIFEQDPAAGLYVPIRVFVYESKDGKTYVSYDKPSALLAPLNNPNINMVAGMLDQKLQGLVQMATH